MEVKVLSLCVFSQSKVEIDGKAVVVSHNRLISKDAKRTQKCRIYLTLPAITAAQAKAVREAIEVACEQQTSELRARKAATN